MTGARLRSIRRTLVVALVLALSALGLSAQPAVAASSPAPIPVVSGNRILDARTGAVFVPHSVNWPSFEYACQQGWAYASDGATVAAARAMAGWGINSLRLPLNEACWLGVDGSPAYGSTTGYRAAIRAWVEILNAAGIVVILDLHWNAPAGYTAAGQRAMADARSTTFWQQVATAYASSPSVMFDAFNEPYSRWNPSGGGLAFELTWACWRDGGCRAPVENDESSGLSGTRYTVTGMATLVSAIRDAGATQPILLAGLDYANDLRGWLANRPSDTQLIASWHNYPGQRCSNAACWNSEIAPVAAVVPVIATEFGQTDGDSGFLTTFMTWADAQGIGYSPWAWWEVDASESVTASRYALITDSTTFTPKAPSGTAYHDHLASLGTPTPPASTAPIDIYRFWSPTYATHFFTASPAERDAIRARYPTSIWTYEGVAYQAFSTAVPGTVPLSRFWSAQLGGHFFTASSAEKESVMANLSSVWSYEGTAFYVYPASASVAGSVAVTRFWSPANRHHFYTASAAEARSIVATYPASIWTSEGETFRVPGQ